MNKKVKAYFLVFASLFAISCSNDGKIITVKNELNLDRKFETVEINLKEESLSLSASVEFDENVWKDGLVENWKDENND